MFNEGNLIDINTFSSRIKDTLSDCYYLILSKNIVIGYIILVYG